MSVSEFTVVRLLAHKHKKQNLLTHRKENKIEKKQNNKQKRESISVRTHISEAIQIY